MQHAPFLTATPHCPSWCNHHDAATIEQVGPEDAYVRHSTEPIKWTDVKGRDIEIKLEWWEQHGPAQRPLIYISDVDTDELAVEDASRLADALTRLVVAARLPHMEPKRQRRVKALLDELGTSVDA